jgi:hypothetical protein
LLDACGPSPPSSATAATVVARAAPPAGGGVDSEGEALVKVSANLDAEQAKTKNTHHEYLGKMRAHTDHTKHTLNLDKMLGEKKVQLDEEWDLAL